MTTDAACGVQSAWFPVCLEEIQHALASDRRLQRKRSVGHDSDALAVAVVRHHGHPAERRGRIFTGSNFLLRHQAGTPGVRQDRSNASMTSATNRVCSK